VPEAACNAITAALYSPRRREIGHSVRVVDREFLVAYDYGMGGLWAIVLAESDAAIRSAYPELTVVHDRPPWMDDARYATLCAEPLRLDSPEPQGILKAVVADRNK